MVTYLIRLNQGNSRPIKSILTIEPELTRVTKRLLFKSKGLSRERYDIGIELHNHVYNFILKLCYCKIE